MNSDLLREFSKRALATLRLWTARGQERRRLEDLDDHMLADIGVTREAARREAQRPPWSGSGVRDRARSAHKYEAAPQRRLVTL